MRREAFGALAALSDADLARALVGVAASSYRLREPLSFDALARNFPDRFRPSRGQAGETILEVTVPLVALQRYAALPARRKDVAQALAHWRDLFQLNKPPATRYCLELTGARNDPTQQIDLDWLLSLLGNQSLSSVAVFAAWPPEPSAFEWEWPLRVGIAPGVSAALLRGMVERCAYRELFTVVEFQAAETRCDVLLFSSSLRDAVRSTMDLATVRASAVLLLGGLDAPWTHASPWLNGLRRQFHAGAVGTCFVPSGERGIWFQAFVQELSHNATLDRALFAASGVQARNEQAWNFPEAGNVRATLEPPLLLAEREFLDGTRVADTAKRIATATATSNRRDVEVEMPQEWHVGGAPRRSLRDVGVAVASIADTLPWQQERGDATRLRRFRESVERATGSALVLQRIAVGAPPLRTTVVGTRSGVLEKRFGAPSQPRPPQPAVPRPRGSRRIRSVGPTAGGELPPTATRAQPPQARREQRRVQLDLFRARDDSRQMAVEPSTDYRTHVFISPQSTGTVQANAVLDETRLEPSSTGHQIMMVFTPLWKDARGEIPAAQMLDVHLPAFGPSGFAQFHFTTPKELTAFRARLVLLNQFRVLQTLLLHCPQQSGAATGALRLTEENVVSADYGQDTISPPFEAALIVNDSPMGVTGLTTIAGGGAQFFEPAGLDVLLKQIRADLGSLNAPDDDSQEVITGLDDERVNDLMFRLALRGAGLAKELKRQPQLGAFLSAPRLQVVDAVSGAFFPVELVYDGKAPMEGAKRCEHSIDALENQSVHDECPNRKSGDHFCPAAFWGFSKCIERQPSNGQLGYGFSQPAFGDNTLRPLKSVLFAASQKVRQVDIVPPLGLQAVFTQVGMGFDLAKTWNDWTTQIGLATPSMLVLLPHSLNSAAAADLPALEIGGAEVASVQMDETYVHGSGDERPVVLLLGCSTALSDIPFLSFVREFRFNGAAVTVGTLATIRGRQTVEFIKAFLEQLKRVAQEELTFDEAILRVKRRMLAKGDPFVLSLVAYGDTGWRVRL